VTGNRLSPTQITDLKNALAGKGKVAEELNTNLIVPPNVTFDRELNVNLGNREVQLKHLGRGNTSGDVTIYLPKEKILVVGDVLDHPVPYLGGGYPVEEVETLKRMALLDARAIVPGQGDVMHDKVFLNDVIDFIQTVVNEVSKQIYVVGNGPRNLDEVRKNVRQSLDMEQWQKKLGGTSKEDHEFFDSFSVNGVITARLCGDMGKAKHHFWRGETITNIEPSISFCLH
jgi:glyoxylase-like metal-dependent hydrolase (beta-lactamase superfamily II)